MLGSSSGGFVHLVAAMSQPPHLLAIAPMQSWSSFGRGNVSDPGGGYTMLQWWALCRPTPTQSSVSARTADDDEHWRLLDASAYYDRIRTPAPHLVGWFDRFSVGTPRNYAGILERGATPAARAHAKLVIGPWSPSGRWLVLGTPDTTCAPEGVRTLAPATGRSARNRGTGAGRLHHDRERPSQGRRADHPP